MAEQVTIKNKNISVTIAARGAELQNITKNGVEYLWEGDPAVWASRAPILFPICGGLKEDSYILDGGKYSIKKHGYARYETFEVESAEEEKVVFLLRSDEKSMAQFPFAYEFRVIYTLTENGVDIEYAVKNNSEKEMYFSVGAHEGFACPEGIEEYSIIFEKEEELDSTILDGNFLTYETINVGKNTVELPLKTEYFLTDALVFLNLRSRRASLLHRESGRKLTVDFEGFDTFLLWTFPNAKYICLEPWAGMPDFVDSDMDITHKKGIIALPSGSETVRKHSIIL